MEGGRLEGREGWKKGRIYFIGLLIWGTYLYHRDGWGSKGKGTSMDKRLERRKNVNRGYRKLRTWQMAIELYAFLYEKVKEIPDRPYRLIAQILEQHRRFQRILPKDTVDVL